MKSILNTILTTAICGAALAVTFGQNPPAAAPRPDSAAGNILFQPAEGGITVNPYNPTHPKPGVRISGATRLRRGQRMEALVFNNEVFGGHRMNRPLMIRGSRADAKAMDQLSEDLTVMARILDKAVAEHIDDFHAPKAAGIDIYTLARGDAKSARTMYVDDYGAIFTLAVDMPLKPDPMPEEEDTKESVRDGAWEEARNELFGRKPKVGTRPWAGPPGREFDQGEVDELKSSLLEALKNATNIRHLKASDLITLVVRGTSHPEQGGEVSLQFEENGKNLIVNESANAESTLVLRVTKAELDKATGGKESGDLRKSVRISVY